MTRYYSTYGHLQVLLILSASIVFSLRSVIECE
jgi:hypothetical protein